MARFVVTIEDQSRGEDKYPVIFESEDELIGYLEEIGNDLLPAAEIEYVDGSFADPEEDEITKEAFFRALGTRSYDEASYIYNELNDRAHIIEIMSA